MTTTIRMIFRRYNVPYRWFGHKSLLFLQKGTGIEHKVRIMVAPTRLT